jgi:CRP/FNR family cyclic AMP-dependent transcriptional regulator
MDWFFRTSSWIDDDVYDLLNTSPLFEGLQPADYRELANLLHESSYEAGERVFTEGDPSTAIYFVKKGSITIFRQNAEGERVNLNSTSQGDFFGELALCEGHERSASAEAAEQSVLLGMFRQELSEFIWRRQTCGIQILFNMVEVVGDRLYDANNSVETLRTKLSQLKESDEPTPETEPSTDA